MASKNQVSVELEPEDLNEVLLLLVKLGLQAEQRNKKAPASAANTDQGSPRPHNNDEVKKKGAQLL